MKKVAQEQIDAAIDAVTCCYGAISDAQSSAITIQYAFRWNDYGYRLAEDLLYHLRIAEQILATLDDHLEGGDEANNDADE